MNVPPSRIEWAEWRQDQLDEFRETHYIPSPLEAMRKEARKVIIKSVVQERKGQRRIDEYPRSEERGHGDDG